MPETVRLFLFSLVHRRRRQDRGYRPAEFGRTPLKMAAPHPTPANISALAADRRPTPSAEVRFLTLPARLQGSS